MPLPPVSMIRVLGLLFVAYGGSFDSDLSEADSVVLLQTHAKVIAGIATAGEAVGTPLGDLLPSEVSALCHETGLALACDALNNVAGKEQQLIRLHDTGKCFPGGSVVFDHVMKTGGLSVDGYFRCACHGGSGLACAIQRSDGMNKLVQPSHGVCEPSICTAHGHIADISERCGEIFDQASHFTVLRDPVDRVWSFYNFLSRWYVPYQENSLESILTNYTHDFNKDLPPNAQCGLCHKQLSNAMVHKFDKTRSDSLKEAKRVLAGFTAILDITAVRSLPKVLNSTGIFPDMGACPMPHTNPSVYRYGKEPDTKTRALIIEYNKDDVALYEHAKTLSNFVA